MQLDPTKWLVNIAGFGYDWIITREWKRALLTMIPVFLLATLGCVVLWGKNMSKSSLAQWYLTKGEAEISDWEEALVGDPTEDGAESETKETNKETPEEPSGEDEEEDSKKISRYADMLFRRVQMLSPSDRAQYIIGANLAQSGAIDQGKEMLEGIAPSDGNGYAPAHAFLAMLDIERIRQLKEQVTPERQKELLHHITQASRLEKVPESILIVGSQLNLQNKNRIEGMRLLQKAAESNKELNLQVIRLAKDFGLEMTENEARDAAIAHFKKRLEEDPRDDTARVGLAEVYSGRRGTSGLDLAEEVLREGEKLESTQKIRRGLSEIYRLRFRRNLINNQGAADVKLLDIAMRIDPTNPLVVEEIASLARIQGPQVTQEMIKKLTEFLAEGKATAATHAWLAESYLVRDDFKKALPHLEQIVLRLPNSPQYLNNLAYVLLELDPERLEEAEEYAERSVAAAKIAGNPNADFFDTLGTIYGKLGKRRKAIASFETAIEMSPKRQDFHLRAAEVYELEGNTMMASTHRKIIARLEKEALEAAEAEAARKAAEADLAAAEQELDSQNEKLNEGEDQAEVGNSEAGEADNGDSETSPQETESGDEKESDASADPSSESEDK